MRTTGHGFPTCVTLGLGKSNPHQIGKGDGRYTDDSGCGNDINPADGNVRRLVLEALDRLGVVHGLIVPATPGWQSGKWRTSKYYQEAACFA